MHQKNAFFAISSFVFLKFINDTSSCRVATRFAIGDDGEFECIVAMHCKECKMLLHLIVLMQEEAKLIMRDAMNFDEVMSRARTLLDFSFIFM